MILLTVLLIYRKWKNANQSVDKAQSEISTFVEALVRRIASRVHLLSGWVVTEPEKWGQEEKSTFHTKEHRKPKLQTLIYSILAPNHYYKINATQGDSERTQSTLWAHSGHTLSTLRANSENNQKLLRENSDNTTKSLKENPRRGLAIC